MHASAAHGHAHGAHTGGAAGHPHGGLCAGGNLHMSLCRSHGPPLYGGHSSCVAHDDIQRAHEAFKSGAPLPPPRPKSTWGAVAGLMAACDPHLTLPLAGTCRAAWQDPRLNSVLVGMKRPDGRTLATRAIATLDVGCLRRLCSSPDSAKKLAVAEGDANPLLGALGASPPASPSLPSPNDARCQIITFFLRALLELNNELALATRGTNNKTSRRKKARVQEVVTAAFNLCVEHGRGDCLTLLIAAFEDLVAPEAESSLALRRACANGYGSVVAVLLADGRADPTARDYAGLIAAAERSHSEVLILLMNEPRVDLGLGGAGLLQTAASHGRVDVVRLLLSDPRVNPGADEQFAVQLACRNGHANCVAALLKDPRVDPSAVRQDAVRWACRHGHAEVVKLLLNDPRVDPSAVDQDALRWASENGVPRVVELLLKDPRVDPTAADNAALKAAERNRNAEVVALLKDKAAGRGIFAVEAPPNELDIVAMILKGTALGKRT